MSDRSEEHYPQVHYHIKVSDSHFDCEKVVLLL